MPFFICIFQAFFPRTCLPAIRSITKRRARFHRWAPFTRWTPRCASGRESIPGIGPCQTDFLRTLLTTTLTAQCPIIATTPPGDQRTAIGTTSRYVITKFLISRFLNFKNYIQFNDSQRSLKFFKAVIRKSEAEQTAVEPPSDESGYSDRPHLPRPPVIWSVNLSPSCDFNIFCICFKVHFGAIQLAL